MTDQALGAELGYGCGGDWDGSPCRTVATYSSVDAGLTCSIHRRTVRPSLLPATCNHQSGLQGASDIDLGDSSLLPPQSQVWMNVDEIIRPCGHIASATRDRRSRNHRRECNKTAAAAKSLQFARRC